MMASPTGDTVANLLAEFASQIRRTHEEPPRYSVLDVIATLTDVEPIPFLIIYNASIGELPGS